MNQIRNNWPIVIAVVVLILTSTTLASAQSYNATTFLVSSKLGIGTTRPASPLHIEFPKIGSVQATTPSGNGPGLLFLAANGRRRDIVAWNGGLYLGASPSASAPTGTLQVCDNGTVGVGLASCPTNILQIQQRSRTDPVADAWTTYSSRTYKTDITRLNAAEYQAALQALLDTPLVRFHYKGQAAGEKLKLGIIAEEAPAAILAEGNEKAVSLGEYISLLHAAVVAQQSQIEVQQAQIEALEAAIAEMK